MPNSTQEKLLKRTELQLSDLKLFVDQTYLCHKLYHKASAKWGDYFQSPVNKVAATLLPAFEFDERGALRDKGTHLKEAQRALFEWLDVPREAMIEEWLRSGKPLSPERLDVFKRKLSEETLTNHSLYNQPICRLVHRSQLRRDLDYQVIYQVTPGQSRLLDLEEDLDERPSLVEVKRNQRAYWGMSETFQSLVAMFDSDLGSSKGYRSPTGRPMTKELIRIQAEGEQDLDPLAPKELNKYSPLRFWSPPPAFAGSVFHMLFWRDVITGRDLFRRSVVKEEKGGGDPTERADYYYVMLNWFNAAKFRLANYEKLFQSLTAIAGIVGSEKRIKQDSPLYELGDISLPNEALLYPDYFPHTNVKFREFPKLNITLPFASAAQRTWELALGYQETSKDDPTRVSALLRFLRDKALELIIWSKYQMEIRSVGLIPVQHLYRIELTKKGRSELNVLADSFKETQSNENQPLPKSSTRRLTEINESVLDAIRSNKRIEDWIVLKKVYGGTYRTIIDKAAWGEIKRLESPRGKSSSPR